MLTGLDRVLRDGLVLPGEGRIGVLCNATTVASDWTPTADALAHLRDVRLERIFSPQHGFAAEKQDNMIASADGVHARLGVPIVSLYGERREPAPGAFDGLDALVIDIQDVGTRVYTFLVTALHILRAAKAHGTPVVVLDRPNPIGGAVEGPVLEDAFRSFVGIVDVPLRHGLTAAEYCLYGAMRLGLLDETEAALTAARTRAGVEDEEWLRIVPLEGWKRTYYADDASLPWMMPSPNMPTLDTAIVYPGQVVLEATNLSEGRGTTRPFELFGAPYLDPAKIAGALARGGAPHAAGAAVAGAGGTAAGSGALAGALLREVAYEPTFHKFAGALVRGFQLHVLDRELFRPVYFTTALLRAVRDAHPAEFTWREPPYEYEWTRMPADLVYGNAAVREALDAGATAEEIARGWDAGVAAYAERVRPLWLYEL